MELFGDWIRSSIGLLLGLWAISSYNIFDHTPYLNEKEKAFDIALIIYGSMGVLLVNRIWFFICNWRKSIQVSFGIKDVDTDKGANPGIVVRMDSYKTATIRIEIDRSKYGTVGKKIVVNKLNYITMQLPRKCKEAYIDEQGNLIIEIDKLFTDQEEKNIVQTLHVLLIQEPYYGECNGYLTAVVVKPEEECFMNSLHYKLYTFESNKLKVRTEE